MQQNLPTSHEQQQPQPTLPSYAEAMRTAAPPNFNYARTVDQETYHPTGPTTIYTTSIQSIPVHPQYPNQSNYTQMPFPATICTYPPNYTTNPYTTYGQAAEDCPGGPTTIHIIRPVSAQSTACCSGTRSRILGVVLGLIIVGAILRITLNATF